MNEDYQRVAKVASDDRPKDGRVPLWTIECRSCKAWFTTYLRDDITRWLDHHDHTRPPSPTVDSPN